MYEEPTNILDDSSSTFVEVSPQGLPTAFEAEDVYMPEPGQTTIGFSSEEPRQFTTLVIESTIDIRSVKALYEFGSLLQNVDFEVSNIYACVCVYVAHFKSLHCMILSLLSLEYT